MRGAYSVIAGILLATFFRPEPCESAATEADTGDDALTCEVCEAFIDSLDEKASSTLKTRSSLPVGFFGEGRFKIQYHDLKYFPSFMRQDRSWIQSGWEGNEGLLRLGMSVNIGSSVKINSQIGFQSTLPGNYVNDPADAGRSNGDPQGIPAQNRHDDHNEPAYIHDDMKAEIELGNALTACTVSFGGLQWIEASPLILWKNQTRMFAWDHPPFESEEPIAIFYDKNLSKVERTGRSAWNKKPFYGLGLKSGELPHDLNINLFYGIYERYDSGEREFVDYSGELDYTSLPTEAKLRGISDSYHHALHIRLAKAKIFNTMTVGFNYIGYDVQKTLKNSQAFWKAFFGERNGNPNNPYEIFRANPRSGTLHLETAFYKEPKIGSFDIKGAVNNRLEMQADIALSVIDTTFVRYDSVHAHEEKPLKRRAAPACYGFLKSAYGVPATIDLAYISPGFYSPFSFAAPSDAFYSFGSNLAGPGKFIARGEASPYAQNMAGAVVGVSPNIGFGHCKFSYGQHFQIRTARDIIFFPYRLNGLDLSSFFHSSYNRWGIDLLDVSLINPYAKRLGDESFKRPANQSEGPDAGGIRQDCPGTFEGFVPYENGKQADANYHETTSISTRSINVPRHKKFTFNLEADGACNMSKLVGFQKEFFLSFYGAINGISTKITPIAFNQKDQLLWSIYARFEPSIALSNKFYILGLAGYENWRSDKAWMYDKPFGHTDSMVISSPIDFRDIAFGLGFDWELVTNVGLHARFKWMRHKDIDYYRNDWETPVFSMETKMVF
jgi:hypothetical protein